MEHTAYDQSLIEYIFSLVYTQRSEGPAYEATISNTDSSPVDHHKYNIRSL